MHYLFGVRLAEGDIEARQAQVEQRARQYARAGEGAPPTFRGPHHGLARE
jgi:hypothetical protein